MDTAPLHAMATATGSDLVFRHIAACVNGSAMSELVVPHALAIARAFGGRVTVVRVLECGTTGNVPTDPLEWDIRRREAREHVEHLVREGGANVPITAVIVESRAADAICLWAERHEVDLMVLCRCNAPEPAEWPLARDAPRPDAGVGAHRARAGRHAHIGRSVSAAAGSCRWVESRGKRRATCGTHRGQRRRGVARRARGAQPGPDRDRSARRRGRRASRTHHTAQRACGHGVPRPSASPIRRHGPGTPQRAPHRSHSGPRPLDSLQRVTTFRAPLHVSLPGAIAFVQAYQQQGAWLTIAELWAVPAVLRLASLGIV